MRLEQTDTVDFLGFDKKTGDIQVTLIDDCDWGDEEAHLDLLRRKLERYFDFIESGEVHSRLREHGRTVLLATPVNIQILAKCALPDEGERLISRAREVAVSIGSGLTWKRVGRT